MVAVLWRKQANKGMALSPFDPLAYFFSTIAGMAYLMDGHTSGRSNAVISRCAKTGDTRPPIAFWFSD
jgi:hypothetical protein